MDEFSTKIRTKDEFDGLAEKAEENQTFRKFKDKSIAAKDWINDLLAYGYRYPDKRGRRALKEEGLFLSDEMQDVGILSLAPALSALLFEVSLLKNNDEIAAADKDGNAEQMTNENSFASVMATVHNKTTVLDKIVRSICKLIAECFPDGDFGSNRVLLSSMPFFDDSDIANDGWGNGGYLDTASWVFLAADMINAFLGRLQKRMPDAKIKWDVRIEKRDEPGSFDTITLKTIAEVKEIIKKIYLASIKVACDCIIKREDEYLGWTFRKMNSDEAEPSLYFSYVASTVYLGLYKRFNRKRNENDSFGMIDRLREFEKEISKNKELHDLRYFEGITDDAKRKETLNKLEKNNLKDFATFLDNLSDDDREEMDLLFNQINNRQPLTYKINNKDKDGAFSLLKEASTALAEKLWSEGFGSSENKKPFRLNMAKGPCFEDGSLVDMDVIHLSSHNNAFFNNLFVIGIILNSGYDEAIKKDDEENDKHNYDHMLNVFQLSIQNTQRCYNEIKDKGLLYKIDSYILDFSDGVDEKNSELAKQLRKVNMAVVPLLPLMLKNNNLMSEYVIKYPQKQMIDSLKDIIANKKHAKDPNEKENGKKRPRWVWDNDGYNAITNYYYVDALISFYRYYEKYEAPFIDNEKKMIERVNSAIAKERTEKFIELEKKEKEFNAIIKQKDSYIGNVRTIAKGVAQFVVNGLIDLVDEQLVADKLLSGIDPFNPRDPEDIIEKLNSIDKDTDTVKLSNLIHLSEKLQLLSLLSLAPNPQITAFLKNGTADKRSSHYSVVEEAFGKPGNSSKFLLNLISSLVAPKDISTKKPDSDTTN